MVVNEISFNELENTMLCGFSRSYETTQVYRGLSKIVAGLGKFPPMTGLLLSILHTGPRSDFISFDFYRGKKVLVDTRKLRPEGVSIKV